MDQGKMEDISNLAARPELVQDQHQVWSALPLPEKLQRFDRIHQGFLAYKVFLALDVCREIHDILIQCLTIDIADKCDLLLPSHAHHP